MIKLLSMVLTCAGFVLSGICLSEGAWRLFAYVFVATWIWFAVPRIPAWTAKGIGKLFNVWKARRASA